jgi:hypothetical protein
MPHRLRPTQSATPQDQADGLRRLFVRHRTCMVPVVSNPHVAFGGLMLERLCTAFSEQGRSTLVIDASERASAPLEMSLLDLSACIEVLSPQVSYLAARGLPLHHVNSVGSTAAFLQAVTEAAPGSDVVLVHASASELCRMFGRHAGASPVRPLLLADDRPTSVTHAFAGMKLLTQRAGLLVHDLLLGAAHNSPRAKRIGTQLGRCADTFLSAALGNCMHIDPACRADEDPTPELRRWVREQLARVQSDDPPQATAPMSWPAPCMHRAMAAH